MLDDGLLKDAQQSSGLLSIQATIEAALHRLIQHNWQKPQTAKLLEQLNQAYAEEPNDQEYLKKMRRLYSAS